MANIFTLLWCWHEEDMRWMFYHPDKTEKQFDEDCKALLIKYGKEFIEQETSWIGAHEWIAYISKKLPELGYVPINSDHNFGHFGSYIIDHDPEKPMGEDDKEWLDIVGPELMDLAIQKNREIQNECNKKYGK